MQTKFKFLVQTAFHMNAAAKQKSMTQQLPRRHGFARRCPSLILYFERTLKGTSCARQTWATCHKLSIAQDASSIPRFLEQFAPSARWSPKSHPWLLREVLQRDDVNLFVGPSSEGKKMEKSEHPSIQHPMSEDPASQSHWKLCCNAIRTCTTLFANE